jgi:SAM-dependent methyltransferase
MSHSYRFYTDLARWWPLISPPGDYVEEAADLLPSLLGAPDAPPRSLLELGSGGGSLAFHLKGHFALTLTDLSSQMLEVSRAVNPECEHLPGDMRTLDLGRRFDLVLMHDAVMYMADDASLRAALATAARHCRPGGGLAVLPDCVEETFAPDSDVSGYDGPDGRGVRMLEWTWDPVPGDGRFTTAYAFVLRHVDGAVSVEHDVHVEGLFPRASWLRWLDEAGFEVTMRRDPWHREVFVGRRRA